MAIPIADPRGVVEITVKGAAGTRRVYNVLHFYYPNPVIPGTFVPELSELLDSFIDWWRSQVLPLLSNSYIVGLYDARVLTDIVPSGGPPAPYPWKPFAAQQFQRSGDISLDNGQQTGEAQHTFCAACVRKITEVPGRAHRGSIHYGPLTEAQTTFQTLAGATQAAFSAATMQVVTNGLIADSDEPGEKYRMCVLSMSAWLRPGLPIPPRSPWSFSETVESAPCNGLVGSMVSRKQRPFV